MYPKDRKLRSPSSAVSNYVAILQCAARDGPDFAVPFTRPLTCSHKQRLHARQLLAVARASREAAQADACSVTELLKELRKATEMLQVQEVVAITRLRDADRQIGAIRGAG